MNPIIKKYSPSILIFLILSITSLGIYSQGLNGPFVFDDAGNIEDNSLLRITDLNLDSISTSALSGRAGPLKRPVAMLSFALNYYFSGSLKPFPYKLTNVFIQAICGWLVFILSRQLLSKANTLNRASISNKVIHYFAFSIALLWVAHPINLTSVLYVVQRMTSLSTLFTLATLICYIKARNNTSTTNWTISLLFYLISFISFLLAIFSKENALLIPAYLLLIEWAFFRQQQPWAYFSTLSVTTRKTFRYALIVFCTVVTLFALDYAASHYGNRTFTMAERILTEPRIICFYLSLIVLPRINAFGVFHDDIPLSTSLIDPWSTLPAIFFIISLIFLAIRIRKNKPLFSFGILFFFTGHLLESTIFGLELAHEHRNHLASIGILIAIIGFFFHQPKLNRRSYLLFVSSFFIIFSTTTVLRAHEWQAEYSLAVYEAEHHPESPATLGLLSNAAFKQKEYKLSEAAIRKARTLDPAESAYAINSFVIASILGKPIDQKLANEISIKLEQNILTPSTQVALAHISTHLRSEGFIPLQPYFIEWLNIVLDKLGKTKQTSIYHYFLAKAYLATGDTLKAINAHQQAYNLDKKFINPLFEIGNIFLALKQTDNARIILKEIKKANKNPNLGRHYDIHIDELNTAILQIEKANKK